VPKKKSKVRAISVAQVGEKKKTKEEI
jgi:hypothetical protein